MNYRHAFHAGNHADVLKHALLVLCLARLLKKPKPIVAIDAFAGGGLVDLALDDRPARTDEWRGGVGRLWPDGALAGAPAPLQLYEQALRKRNPQGALRFLPGSPLLSLDLLRPEDKLLAVERHPEEAETLRRRLGEDKRARIYEEDGWLALRSFLPPTPRRGLVLIDPPFERPGEYDRLAEALRDGLRRWATGVFLLWHPVKDLAEAAAYEKALADAAGETPLLLAELRVAAPGSPGLIGSGLAVANPPYGLEEDAAALGPILAERLAGAGGGWRLEWLTSPR